MAFTNNVSSDCQSQSCSKLVDTFQSTNDLLPRDAPETITVFFIFDLEMFSRLIYATDSLICLLIGLLIVLAYLCEYSAVQVETLEVRFKNKISINFPGLKIQCGACVIVAKAPPKPCVSRASVYSLIHNP